MRLAALSLCKLEALSDDPLLHGGSGFPDLQRSAFSSNFAPRSPSGCRQPAQKSGAFSVFRSLAELKTGNARRMPLNLTRPCKKIPPFLRPEKHI